MSRCADLRRAAAMAYRVLAAQKVDTLPVDPLALLRACRDTCVYTLQEAADALGVSETALDQLLAASEAETWVRESTGQYVVCYRPGGNPARLRFTLAHELGHRVLGHTGREYPAEREADCFASHLLCPEPVLQRLRERVGDLRAERLAVACYVSTSCAKLALQRTSGPADDPAYGRVDELLRRAADDME